MLHYSLSCTLKWENFCLTSQPVLSLRQNCSKGVNLKFKVYESACCEHSKLLIAINEYFHNNLLSTWSKFSARGKKFKKPQQIICKITLVKLSANYQNYLEQKRMRNHGNLWFISMAAIKPKISYIMPIFLPPTGSVSSTLIIFCVCVCYNLLT